MKRIVIYYSLENNTKEAAEQISKILGANILEVRTVKEVPKQGFQKFLIGGMQAVFGICPKISNTEFNPVLYDEIIIGTPVWADKCAPAIRSFLKEYDVKQKAHAVFTCSGGGDNEKCIVSLKKMIPDIRHTVALADRRNKLAEKNTDKIKEFVEEIEGGKRKKD